jgi:hypothetical protein
MKLDKAPIVSLTSVTGNARAATLRALASIATTAHPRRV